MKNKTTSPSIQQAAQTCKSNRQVWIAYACALFAGIAPSIWLIDPGTLWDDNVYMRHYIGHAWEAGLRPFVFGNTYWRPLATSLMGFPMHWIQQMGGEGYFMMYSKAISLVLFAMAGLAAGVYALRGAVGSKAVPAIVLGVLIGMHPVFAEPSMWWSDRFDLMMCGWVALLLAASTKPENGSSMALGALLASAACLTKESGFFWTTGLAALCIIVHGKARVRLASGLALGTIACAVLRTAVITWVEPSFTGEQNDSVQSPWSLDLFISTLGRYVLHALVPGLEQGPVHLTQDMPHAEWLGLGVCAGLAVVIWACLKARSRGLYELSMIHGWVALSIVVAGAQAALVSFVAPEFVTFPSIAMRYAAPSILVLMTLAGRVAMGTSRISGLVLCGLLSAIAAAAPYSTPAKMGFASELDLWEQTQRAHPSMPSVAAQHCRMLKGNGQQSKARRFAAEWRASNPGIDAPKLDEFCPPEEAEPAGS